MKHVTGRRAVNMPSYDKYQITGAQIRAARALVRLSADDLAARSKIGVATIRRAEAYDGATTMTAANAEAIRKALESVGVEFIPENGGGAGVRLKHRGQDKS
jgi:ribosome-binding protein aMBF1 (putative translation factor)